MDTFFKDKVILVTGASSGIGKAIALHLAECGATVVLFGGRNLQNLEQAKNKVAAFGFPCLAVPGDLTDFATLDSGIKTVIDTFGKIDVLINDAGSAQGGPFEDISEEEFDKIMALDIKVPFFLTQKALPHLKKSDFATVINISSVVGNVGYPLQSAYSAAKHALNGFSQSLAKEIYKDNVRVHIISPGGVLTDMIKLTRPDLAGADMILPEDIADTVEYLLRRRKSNAVIDEVRLHRTGKEPFLV